MCELLFHAHLLCTPMLWLVEEGGEGRLFGYMRVGKHRIQLGSSCSGFQRYRTLGDTATRDAKDSW